MWFSFSTVVSRFSAEDNKPLYNDSYSKKWLTVTAAGSFILVYKLLLQVGPVMSGMRLKARLLALALKTKSLQPATSTLPSKALANSVPDLYLVDLLTSLCRCSFFVTNEILNLVNMAACFSQLA